jgi:HAE1 family hydrophobic/amphiphilic exporter-1
MFLLAKASMRNRALIALITVIVAVFGGLALTNLKQELAPSIQFPQLAVLSTYTGASPDVVNQDVSSKLEAAIQGVPNVDSTVLLPLATDCAETVKVPAGDAEKGIP